MSSARLAGVELFGTGEEPRSVPVDIAIDNGVIAAIEPSASAPSRRLLAMPALANAHDHARPLSPTSFGGAGKPLETWLLRLGAMPSIDPYLGALAAFGRAARGGRGLGDGALHARARPDVASSTRRAKSPAPPRRRRARDVRGFHARSQSVGLRAARAVLDGLPAEPRGVIEAQFLSPMPSAAEQVARVEAIAAAVESPTFTVQFGPNGAAMVLGRIARAPSRKPPRAPAAASICISWRRCYQRAFRRPRLSARGRARISSRSACFRSA